MDIRLMKDAPTAEEITAVDALLGAQLPRDTRLERGGKAARDLRHLLLPALHAVNDRIGWISAGALNYICRRLSVPPADAFGVATFYHMFSLQPRPQTIVHVCDDIACVTNGSEAVCAAMEEHFGPSGGAWQRSPCLGLCDRAPAALVTQSGPQPVHTPLGNLGPADAATLLERSRNGRIETPHIGGTHLRLLRRVGKIDPRSIDEYRAHGGYLALRRALDIGPDAVIAEITASKLVGRGGAAFPAGRKMDAVARAPVHPHYVICNADESEPGTFKDRILMEHDPFAIVEALTISGIAAGCEQGYIYVRAEYPIAAERLQHAIEEARRHGFLGDGIMSRGVNFEIELRRGAGAYICGEETALFNSIEGKRGEPRNKPPFPAQAGLFGKPTLVNNVETLACIPDIVNEGGEVFAAIGTPGSAGTKLYCLCGTVARPGLYEVPFGTTLGELIDMGGGVREGRTLRAVLLGGAAGTFVAPDSLDLPLTFEATRAAGATVGSGVVMLFDDTIDLAKIVTRIAAFFRDESCGQCVPCRVGTVRQEEALRSGNVALINDIARVMRDASICGLGQTAANAVESAISLQILETGAS
jgi:NADH-quinone oxidoreductase subunit F